MRAALTESDTDTLMDDKSWQPSPSPEQPLYGACADWPCSDLATVPVMTVNGYTEDYCPTHARLRVLDLVA